MADKPAPTPDPLQPQGTPPVEPTEPPARGETPPETWEAALAALPETLRVLHDAHHDTRTKGLTSALEKERTKASDASKELRTLAKTADADTATKLNDLATEKDAETEKARQELAFTRDAIAEGCNPELLTDAWTIAQANGITSVLALKDTKPWLFSAKTPPARTYAGTGTGTQPAAVKADFDTNLRRAIAGG